MRREKRIWTRLHLKSPVLIMACLLEVRRGRKEGYRNRINEVSLRKSIISKSSNTRKGSRGKMRELKFSENFKIKSSNSNPRCSTALLKIPLLQGKCQTLFKRLKFQRDSQNWLLSNQMLNNTWTKC